MAHVADVAAYLCDRYPHKSELSNARLTKLVYLADWNAAARSGRQLTDIKWFFHNYGPYVDDVVEAASVDERLAVVSTLNHYGDEKRVINLKEGFRGGQGLSEEERQILDDVVETTRSMYWNAFIQHVYNTEPVKQSNRYEFMDLVAIAGKLADRRQPSIAS